MRFTFLHAVMPRGDLGTARGTAGGMAFASFYVDIENRWLLSEGGYHDFPYQVPRWSTSSRGLYGDSPAMLALPDVKMLNAMSKTTIVAAQKAVDPPLLAVDEVAVRGLRTHPGGIIYGGLDENGRRRYEPLHATGNVGLGLELEEQRRELDVLVSRRIRVGRLRQRLVTVIAARREHVDGLMDLVGGHQHSRGPFVPRLAAALATLLVRLLAGLRRGAARPVARRWQVRVRGVAALCLHQLLHQRFQDLHLGRKRRDGLRLERDRGIAVRELRAQQVVLGGGLHAKRRSRSRSAVDRELRSPRNDQTFGGRERLQACGRAGVSSRGEVASFAKALHARAMVATASGLRGP